MGTNQVLPDIKKTMENIASEICDHYCKFPDQYFCAGDEDAETEELVEQHCNMCPLVQFLCD